MECRYCSDSMYERDGMNDYWDCDGCGSRYLGGRRGRGLTEEMRWASGAEGKLSRRVAESAERDLDGTPRGDGE